MYFPKAAKDRTEDVHLHVCVCERERIICDVHTTACYTVSVKDACHNLGTSGPRLLGGGICRDREC